MSTTTDEDVNPYEILGVTLESAEAEIKRAYRQRSLKVHPDRNRGNPDAARKFHELNQAYELLLDPLRRMALDAKIRIKEARKARFTKFDAKRKGLVEELEERERAFKKAKLDKDEKQKELWRENEKIMEEGRTLREEREKELRRREEEALERDRRMKEKERSELELPSLGTLDTTVRLKYSLASHPSLTTSANISELLAPFGAVDSSDIVISLKPSPPKKPKRGIALVPFKQIGDAFAVVCASGRTERGLKDVEITWAEGKEPELIGWLKKMGKLGPQQEDHVKGKSQSEGRIPERSTPTFSFESQPTTSTLESSSAPFSSFPSTFPELQGSSLNLGSSVPGLDYESLTLMRLRQAERDRLEQEIREQEAQES